MRIAVSFVALVFLFLSSFAAWREWKSYHERLDTIKSSSTNLAQALAQHAEDAVKLADMQLIDMVERVERDGQGREATERLHALFKEKVEALPQLHGLFVFDEQGRYAASSQPSLPTGLTIENRDYFKHHRLQNDKLPYIGPPVKSLTTGDWMVTVSRRLNDASGNFAGVVSATLYMDYFRKFYEKFDIGRQGRISIFFENGVVLTQRPFKEDVIGNRIKNGLFERGYFSKDVTGSFWASSAYDGERKRRLFGFQRLERYPLVVVVSVSEEEGFASWRAELYSHIAVLSLVSMILGVLGYRLLLQIKSRTIAEAQLARSHASLKLLSKSLESMAMQDSLTGLPNRRHFNSALSKEFSRAQRYRRPLSLLIIDVDCFKQYNDSYGHIAGDECLRKIGRSLKDNLYRASDLAVRYGGEEFAVILPDTDSQGAWAIGERLRTGVADLDLRHENKFPNMVTISVGIHTLDSFDGSDTSLQLVDGADQALYQAKNKGRNRCSVFARLTREEDAASLC